MKEPLKNFSTETLTDGDIEPVIVPLLPDLDQATIEAIRLDTAYAVRFLEKETLLRYYPVATLLVDDFVVQSVRKELNIDGLPFDEEMPREALTYVEILVILFARVGGFFSNFKLRPEFIGTRDSVESPGSLLDKHRLYHLDELLADIEEFPEIIYSKLIDYAKESYELSIPLHKLARTIICQHIEIMKSSQLTSKWILPISFTFEEYEFIKKEAELVGLASEALHNSQGNIEFSYQKSFFDLVYALLDKIEEEVSDYSKHFYQPDLPAKSSMEKSILGRIITFFYDYSRIENKDNLKKIFSNALSYPEWKKTLYRILQDEKNKWFKPDMDATLTLKKLLDIGSENFIELSNKLVEPVSSVSIEIPKEIWSRIEKMTDTSGLLIKEQSDTLDREDLVFISAPVQGFVDFLKSITFSMINCLEHLRTAFIHKFHRIEVPTYGIFTPKDNLAVDEKLIKWASGQGIHTDLTLPKCSRVLLCLNSLENFKPRNQGVSNELMAPFQRSVLVHEHFHAIVATGLDSEGCSAQGPKLPDSWKEASPVNESLAAWMQLHSCRDHPEIYQLIVDYINTDKYPIWPYAGASALEKIYKEKGISEIHKWINNLRNDPSTCAKEFNQFVETYYHNIRPGLK